MCIHSIWSVVWSFGEPALAQQQQGNKPSTRLLLPWRHIRFYTTLRTGHSERANRGEGKQASNQAEPSRGVKIRLYVHKIHTHTHIYIYRPEESCIGACVSQPRAIHRTIYIMYIMYTYQKVSVKLTKVLAYRIASSDSTANRSTPRKAAG